MILGSPNIGKTLLASRFASNNNNTPAHGAPTLGIDVVDVRHSDNLRLVVYDTGGAPLYRPLVLQYCRHMDMFVLCVNPDSPMSLVYASRAVCDVVEKKPDAKLVGVALRKPMRNLGGVASTPESTREYMVSIGITKCFNIRLSDQDDGAIRELVEYLVGAVDHHDHDEKEEREEGERKKNRRNCCFI